MPQNAKKLADLVFCGHTSPWLDEKREQTAVVGAETLEAVKLPGFG